MGASSLINPSVMSLIFAQFIKSEVVISKVKKLLRSMWTLLLSAQG